MSEAILVPDPVVWLPIEDAMLSTSPILHAMMYAPGLLCEHCYQLLNTGFVFAVGGRLQVAGQVCLFHNFEEPAAPYVSRVEQAQYYGPLWPVNEAKMHRGWRRPARALGLLLQVESDHAFAMGMFRLLETGHALNGQQADVVETMIAERGGIKAMKRRRDLIHRLYRLTSLQLNTDDFLWVLDVLSWSRRWRNGHMNELTKNQEHKIIFLEETHIAERREQVRVVLDSYCAEYAW